jgi:hypothetical protein
MVCVPTSLSQEVGAALGTQAGQARLREVIGAGGFQSVRRATETPFNMVLGRDRKTRAVIVAGAHHLDGVPTAVKSAPLLGEHINKAAQARGVSIPFLSGQILNPTGD